jgi:hypothetical protein
MLLSDLSFGITPRDIGIIVVSLILQKIFKIDWLKIIKKEAKEVAKILFPVLLEMVASLFFLGLILWLTMYFFGSSLGMQFDYQRFPNILYFNGALILVASVIIICINYFFRVLVFIEKYFTKPKQ